MERSKRETDKKKMVSGFYGSSSCLGCWLKCSVIWIGQLNCTPESLLIYNWLFITVNEWLQMRQRPKLHKTPPLAAFHHITSIIMFIIQPNLAQSTIDNWAMYLDFCWFFNCYLLHLVYGWKWRRNLNFIKR